MVAAHVLVMLIDWTEHLYATGALLVIQFAALSSGGSGQSGGENVIAVYPSARKSRIIRG